MAQNEQKKMQAMKLLLAGISTEASLTLSTLWHPNTIFILALGVQQS